MSDRPSIWPCLAMDTSTRNGVLVVRNSPGSPNFTARLDSAITHGRDLAPAIKALMDSSSLRFHDLKSIAVGLGPGSYTGLRVGLAIAKTLAEVLNIQLLPVDSLLLSALNLGPRANQALCLADAQRGSVYQCHYTRNPDTQLWHNSPGEEPKIVDWTELNQYSDKDLILTGPGLALISKFGPLKAQTADPNLWNPSSDSMFAWLDAYAAQTSPVDPLRIEPFYIRPSAAEEKKAVTDSHPHPQ